jgi:hypothetical protein
VRRRLLITEPEGGIMVKRDSWKGHPLLLLPLFLVAGCAFSTGVSFEMTYPGDTTFDIKIINNWGGKVIANVNGFLFPEVGSGAESELAKAHIFPAQGIYFAITSPGAVFDFYETVSLLQPAQGALYHLTITDMSVKPPDVVLAKIN